jgi:hypothetical protein
MYNDVCCGEKDQALEISGCHDKLVLVTRFWFCRGRTLPAAQRHVHYCHIIQFCEQLFGTVFGVMADEIARLNHI